MEGVAPVGDVAMTVLATVQAPLAARWGRVAADDPPGRRDRPLGATIAPRAPRSTPGIECGR